MYLIPSYFVTSKTIKNTALLYLLKLICSVMLIQYEFSCTHFIKYQYCKHYDCKIFWRNFDEGVNNTIIIHNFMNP